MGKVGPFFTCSLYPHPCVCPSVSPSACPSVCMRVVIALWCRALPLPSNSIKSCWCPSLRSWEFLGRGGRWCKRTEAGKGGGGYIF